MTADDPIKNPFHSSKDDTSPNSPTVAHPPIDDATLRNPAIHDDADDASSDDLSILDAWDAPKASSTSTPQAAAAPKDSRQKPLQTTSQVMPQAKPTDKTDNPSIPTKTDLFPDMPDERPSTNERVDFPAAEPLENATTKFSTADATIPRHPLAQDQARALERNQTILPARGPKLIDSQAMPSIPLNTAMTRASEDPPWTLQQFFNGEIDLDLELSSRFPKMPMMSRIKFREVGVNSQVHAAMLSTQDGRANLTIDADPKTRRMQMSFTIESMITLRFMLARLSDMDRDRWLELMRREQGGLAFLWGPDRWQSDYIICLGRKYFTNLYAFSPNNFEAGIRMTPNVSKELLDWLERIWNLESPDEEPPPLLTW